MNWTREIEQYKQVVASYKLKMKRMEMKISDISEEKRQSSMLFDPAGTHSDDKEVCEYWRMINYVDQNFNLIGGMIKMHQYCLSVYNKSGSGYFRDGANFFRNADPLNLSNDSKIPIQMVCMNLWTCEKIEIWYRDFYSHRYLEQVDGKEKYDEDQYTVFDQLFDNLGSDASTLMEQQIELMRNYCQAKAELTNMVEFQRGVRFWRMVSPIHLPRNYQLALILAKRNGWVHEDVERWFRVLYDESCCVGARGRDVYLNFGR
ncbi:uncharacterized protein CELE_C03B1.1 [Caenorhabditis elegans]|uniref:Uncharacterized protein C03B1.1 n=1 Tax=Caenorhabditis elegans TaxID=6239 RepID=YX01_CAEEL|nr:Uncharacterized protein CELE_C03B1.1 [Caenorhabditis elegans]Q11108.2 RecName: Full=Uncharacterized protein C03B1.1 [Caenorhabditis elegans]CCD62737.2 Uncharacterized protein CELE_C03B1.1 [Caenorhabditis elegans]|eukprot:NP_509071.2 Uncharacterized protein CELE_C03B1.1 [Caenorhabditis elegans]